MPRGRPKKTAAEAELLPPEENQPLQKVIKHKTEWVEVVEETPEDTDLELIDDDVETEKRRRKTPKNERDELRKKLAQSGATPGSQLKLTIERYLHSDVVDGSGGMFAETEHCNKYVCSESHVTGEDYIDVARRFGPGLYRFTLRMQNKIVTAWDKRISSTPTTPVIQSVNPADPNSPQVIYQTNGDGQTQIPMSIKDIMKTQREALKEQLEMAKLMREAYGFAPEQQTQQPKSEEEILASAILKQPDVIENVVGSVIKRFGGSGKDSEEPWYADVVRDAVKSGQAAQIVQVAIDRIFNGVQGLFPGRVNNGQAEMGTAAVSPVAHSQNNNPQESGAALLSHAEGQGDAQIQQGMGNDQNAQTPRAISPEEHALQIVIDHCAQNRPPKLAFDRLINYADRLNEQAPQYSIDFYIDAFATMPIDDAIEFVKSRPNGETVASLPHAKEWTAALQQLIQNSQEGEE